MSSSAAPAEPSLNDIAMEISMQFMFEYAERTEMFSVAPNERAMLQKVFRRCFMYMSSPGNLAELKCTPSAGRKLIFAGIIPDLNA